MITWNRRWMLVGLLGTISSLWLSAQTLPTGAGHVLPTISGPFDERNKAADAAVDKEVLMKRQQRISTTMTRWGKTPIKFAGSLVRDAMAAAKNRDQTPQAKVLSNYRSTIPADDAARLEVIVARQMDDLDRPVKTAGPLFMVYPDDMLKDLRATTFYQRSAWQLKALAVEYSGRHG